MLASTFEAWFERYCSFVDQKLEEQNLPKFSFLLVDNCTAHGNGWRSDDGRHVVLFL